MEIEGWKSNIGKTNGMDTGNCDDVEMTEKWLCAVCGKGIRSNSVRFSRGCDGGVHKR